jgi:hypothetical protein
VTVRASTTRAWIAGVRDDPSASLVGLSLGGLELRLDERDEVAALPYQLPDDQRMRFRR